MWYNIWPVLNRILTAVYHTGLNSFIYGLFMGSYIVSTTGIELVLFADIWVAPSFNRWINQRYVHTHGTPIFDSYIAVIITNVEFRCPTLRYLASSAKCTLWGLSTSKSLNYLRHQTDTYVGTLSSTPFTG